MTRKRKPKQTETGHMKAHVVVMDVENPGYQAAHDGAPGNPRTIKANVNINESPAIHWIAKNLITPADLETASKCRKWYEMSESGSLKAMDMSRDIVDGGCASDGITEGRQYASKRLSEIHEFLGTKDYQDFRAVICQCIPLNDYYHSKHSQQIGSIRVRESLARVTDFLEGRK